MYINGFLEDEEAALAGGSCGIWKVGGEIERLLSGEWERLQVDSLGCVNKAVCEGNEDVLNGLAAEDKGGLLLVE